MPAITKLDIPTARNSYASLAEEFKTEEHDKFCGPISLALLANIPVKDAIALCESEGRIDAKGGMSLAQLTAAFSKAGKELKPVSDAVFIAQYPGVHKDLKNVTSHHPRRFPKAFKGRNLLVFTKGHFFAIVNGETQDWTVNATKRAIAIYELPSTEEQLDAPSLELVRPEGSPSNEIIVDLTEEIETPSPTPKEKPARAKKAAQTKKPSTRKK